MKLLMKNVTEYFTHAHNSVYQASPRGGGGGQGGQGYYTLRKLSQHYLDTHDA